mmetsp:Transcript_19009/g.64493  ORF Transcript_19009/g.64493 Transcript_19009/m.64493 type:complete len:268 (+) Transcript_19009:69-872(+)
MRPMRARMVCTEAPSASRGGPSSAAATAAGMGLSGCAGMESSWSVGSGAGGPLAFTEVARKHRVLSPPEGSPNTLASLLPAATKMYDPSSEAAAGAFDPGGLGRLLHDARRWMHDLDECCQSLDMTWNRRSHSATKPRDVPTHSQLRSEPTAMEVRYPSSGRMSSAKGSRSARRSQAWMRPARVVYMSSEVLSVLWWCTLTTAPSWLSRVLMPTTDVLSGAPLGPARVRPLSRSTRHTCTAPSSLHVATECEFSQRHTSSTRPLWLA